MRNPEDVLDQSSLTRGAARPVNQVNKVAKDDEKCDASATDYDLSEHTVRYSPQKDISRKRQQNPAQ